MNKALFLCIFGLATVAMAKNVKVTGYSSSSSSILSPTGKIFISTVLTPEAVPETPVAPVIEEHENSIMPVQPVFVLPNRTSHRPEPVMPVISPIAPPPVSILPWIEAEKPSVGVYPIVRPGLPEPELPENPIDQRPSIDLPVAPVQPVITPIDKPSVGVYPIVRPGLPEEEPEAAVQPIVGKPIVFPVIRPEVRPIAPRPEMTILPVEEPEVRPIIAPQPSIMPIVAPQPSVLPVIRPEVRPIAPRPEMTILPVEEPEVRPIIAPQPSIMPIVAPQPSIMPIVAPQPSIMPIVAPQPSIRPISTWDGALIR